MRGFMTQHPSIHLQPLIQRRVAGATVPAGNRLAPDGPQPPATGKGLKTFVSRVRGVDYNR